MSADGERHAFGWRFTAPLLVACSLNPINSSMLATGLSPIAREFAIGPGAAATLVSVLYLCSAVAQPAMGRLGAVFGHRRVFLAGLLIVVAGGLLGVFEPTFGWLLASRALIGLGTSAAFPIAVALVRLRADRAGIGTPTRMIGLLSISAQVSLVIGLPLGGLLTSAFGWRALFGVNVPLAFAAFIAVVAWGPRDNHYQHQSIRQLLAMLDLVGIALFALATAGLLFFLTALDHPGWWPLGATGLVAAGLIVWERRSRFPLIDVRLLAAEPALARTYLRQMISGLAVFTAFYGLSQWMGTAADLDASASGLILMPLSAVSIILARIVSTRGWVRGPLIGGAVAVIAAGGLLALLHHDMTLLPLALVGVAIVYGVANGLATVAAQTALYLQAPADQIGTAAGLLRSSNHIGAIFSASVISLTFGAAPSDSGLHAQGWVIAGLGATLLLLALDRRLPWRT